MLMPVARGHMTPGANCNHQPSIFTGVQQQGNSQVFRIHCCRQARKYQNGQRTVPFLITQLSKLQRLTDSELRGTRVLQFLSNYRAVLCPRPHCQKQLPQHTRVCITMLDTLDFTESIV